MRVVIYSAPWARDAAVLRDRLVSRFPAAGVYVVDGTSPHARGLGLKSLPCVHVWVDGQLQGRLSGGEISDQKVALLLTVSHPETPHAGSVTSLSADLTEEMEGGMRSTVVDLVAAFRRLVEEQMRGGSARPNDMCLLARADLYLVRESSSSHSRDLIERFLSGDVQGSLEKALTMYGEEFVTFDPITLASEQPWEADTNRPHRRILELMMKSLDPVHPAVIKTRASLEVLLDRKTTRPVIPKRVYIRSGGLPRRQLNGRWTWEGPHWSVYNKNQIKTGHAGSLFDRIGA
jgi:hypothetical protein